MPSSFPYTTLFRSDRVLLVREAGQAHGPREHDAGVRAQRRDPVPGSAAPPPVRGAGTGERPWARLAGSQPPLVPGAPALPPRGPGGATSSAVTAAPTGRGSP